MEENIQITDEEKKLLQEYLEGVGASIPEEKHTVHTFLYKVATSEDTTKIAYITEEELGHAVYPVRSFKSFSLIAEKIIRSNYLKEYFDKESEIITSTSLSKNGFLIRAAITQKKELSDVTKRHTINRGWFVKKPEEEISI